YGLDASAAMLETARGKLRHHGLESRVALAAGLGEALDPLAMFSLDRKFDAVVISYALSMIPPWRAAVERAVQHLRPRGRLVIRDSGDRRGLPRWFQRLLLSWLALFGVEPRDDLSACLADLVKARGGGFTAEPLFLGYAVYAVYTAP